jgi:hypothetical protein
VNIADTADLLTAIATRDQRTVGEADIAAWATDLGDVTFSEGMDAITAFMQSPEAKRRRIVAADIVEWTKARRERERMIDAARDVQADVQAYRQITSGGVDPYGGARNSPQLEALHVEAMEVPCPAKPKGCAQVVGERCGRRTVDGGWEWSKMPHTSRSNAARDARFARGESSVLRDPKV